MIFNPAKPLEKEAEVIFFHSFKLEGYISC